MYDSVTFRSRHPVLTLISKRHKDSSIHIYKRMFRFRLQSSYIRECRELGCNHLDVVLMFISICHTKSSIGNPTQKPDIICTRGQIK